MVDRTARFILTADDRTKLAISGAQRNLQRLGNTANTVRGALGLLGGALVIRQAVRFTGDALKMAGALANTAEKAGITAEQLQVLRFAAEQNGSSADKLDRAVLKLNVNLGQTANFLQGLTSTEGEATQALDALGVSVLDAAGNTRTAAQILPELIDALAAVENPMDRAGLAARIFGARLGPELAVLINAGSGSLKEFEARLRATGSLMSNEVAQAARVAEDQIGAMGTAIRANFQIGVVQGFTGEFQTLEDLFGDPKFQDDIRAVGEAIGSLSRLIIERGPAVAQHLEEIRAALVAITAVRVGATLGSLFGPQGTVVGGGLGLAVGLFADMALQARGANKQLERTADAQRAATKAAIEQTRAQAGAARGLKDRATAEAGALAEMRGVHDDFTESLRADLSAQKTLHDQATKDLEAALTAQKDITKEFADARAELLRGPQAPDEGASFLDAAGLGFEARKALQGGDAERAIELARQAKDVLLELNRQGDGGLASVGLLSQITKTAEAAAAQQTAAVEQTQAQAAAAIQDLANQAEALRNIAVGFDTAKALTDANTLRAALERSLAQNPIVVPVVLQSDPNASFVDKLVPAPPGRARGGYIPGRSPHPRADNILARLTAGEYVLPVPAVRRITHEHGAWVLEALRRGSLPGYALGGLVDAPARPRVDLSAATPAPGQPQAVVNLTLDGRAYRLGADLDTASALAADIRREALKGGRR